VTATKNASGRASTNHKDSFRRQPERQPDVRPLADLWPIYVQFDITAQDLADARRRIAHLEAENRVLRHAVSKQRRRVHV
jgi:hypothetical protein